MTRLLFLLAILFSLYACSGLKNITADDPVYTGSSFEIEPKDKRAKNIVEEVYEGIDPEPNNKFLWMRPAVARYNMLSDSARTTKFWVRKICSKCSKSRLFDNCLWLLDSFAYHALLTLNLSKFRVRKLED